MKATCSETVVEIIQKKQTGLLSLVVKDSANHLKIFFADGEVYNIVFGDSRNADCLGRLEQLAVSRFFFVGDVKVSVKERFSVTGAALVERLKIFDGSAEPEGLKTSVDTKWLTEILDKVKVALIRQVGPVGDLVLSKVLHKWNAPSSPNKQNFVELIDLIQREIDDDEGKQKFIKEAAAIIS